MQKMSEEFEKSLNKRKEDYELSISILQLFNKDMIRQNEFLNDSLLSLENDC